MRQFVHLYKHDYISSVFREKVDSGRVIIRAKDFPSFLYPHDTVYDPDAIDEGLFRGHVFIRVRLLSVLLLIMRLSLPNRPFVLFILGNRLRLTESVQPRHRL
jgi:hypothetical protein